MQGRASAWMRQNVLGLVAIFIALGGTAFAASLARDSVKAKHIRAGAVRNAEIKDNAVTGQKVAPGTLGSSDIDDGSLGGADIADGTLGGGDIADSGLDGADVADGGLSGADVAEGALTGSDVGNDSLTGDDIIDSTLSPTPDCRAGYVSGVAEVDGTATAGGGFSGAGVIGSYSCRSTSGNHVTVRRNGTGDYCVRFDGFSAANYTGASPAISVINDFGFVRVNPGDDIKCPADSYEVLTRNTALTATDRVFTLTAF